MGKAVPRSEMSKADYSSGLKLIRSRKLLIRQRALRPDNVNHPKKKGHSVSIAIPVNPSKGPTLISDCTRVTFAV